MYHDRVRLPASGPRAAIDRRRAGFTLVELMVALGLAAIISVSIMFISSQARLAYQETVKKVDVYNRFRYALHTIDKDLQGWIPTGELEFFNDGRSGRKVNQHWAPGEEEPDRSDEYGTGQVDGGIYKSYDEFAHIIQRHYLSREPFQGEKVHDAYQLYFRTLTYIDGAVREANVEYMLLDPKKMVNGMPQPPDRVDLADVANLSLYKIVRYQVLSPESLFKLQENTIKRKVLEVSTNVTDFKVEYLVDKSAFSRVSPWFRTPEEDFQNPVEAVTRPKRMENAGPRPAYRKVFGYGSAKIEEKFPLAIAQKARRGDDQLARVGADHLPVKFGFLNVREITFAELTPGDQIFVFVDQGQGGGAQSFQGREVAGASRQFPPGDYTVRSNLNGLLEFEEDIDSTSWQNNQQSGLYFKAPFLPSALRVTIRVVDDSGQNPKTLQREVWLRRRSR
jgi:prepilin-type N-terminal cleavage/methylation domain-containing protein